MRRGAGPPSPPGVALPAASTNGGRPGAVCTASGDAGRVGRLVFIIGFSFAERRGAGQAAERWSIMAASSANTGWRVISLSDTARRVAMASCTAVRDMPPRSKKWSCRLDPVDRHLEHLREGGRQHLLGGRGGRPGFVAVALGELGGDRPQRFRVDLAVRGERQALPVVVQRRDHVPGQRLGEAGRQHIRVDRAVGGVERHEVLAPVGPLRHDHGAVADAGHARQGVVDLPISIRKPRILTWLSRRPRNSSFPSGASGRSRRCGTAAGRAGADRCGRPAGCVPGRRRSRVPHTPRRTRSDRAPSGTGSRFSSTM